jgi:hypothetical protein
MLQHSHIMRLLGGEREPNRCHVRRRLQARRRHTTEQNMGVLRHTCPHIPSYTPTCPCQLSHICPLRKKILRIFDFLLDI